jgi:hypothetical protein
MMARAAKLLALIAFFLTALHARAAKNSVTLVWEPNTDQVSGYNVYWGTASGVYTRKSDAGLVVTKTVSNLAANTRYFFAVTAYDSAGRESGYSNEVSIVVPPANPSPTPTPSGTPTPRPTITPTATPTPADSPEPTATPTPQNETTPAPPPQYIANLSTRVRISGGDDVMIGGFIVAGDLSKPVVIRALGPSLASAGLEQPLPDPTLELFDSSGELVDQNDDWMSLPPEAVPPSLRPGSSNESVIVHTLPPGSYTAVMRSADGAPGFALLELYDLAPGVSQVLNMSTRGEVGLADSVMIGGFVIGGSAPAKLLLRAIGPSLAIYGVEGALADPVIELHDSQGFLIYQNDDWRSTQEQEIIGTNIAPSNDKESAIVATLAPGSYTAIVSGASSTAGNALIEIYSIGN